MNIENIELPETWESNHVSDTFSKISVERSKQIPARQIQKQGKYPVIDQGANFVSGFCDDEDKLITLNTPVIVFGDHTRCVKLIDFPFVAGADGTQILQPDPDRFNHRFYYYALRNLNLANRGYNRHFKQLKDSKIICPPLPEQKKIAHVLSTVQRAVEAQEKIIATTTELKKTLMQKLFTEGLRGERQKESEIGPIPVSWEVRRLSDFCNFQSGGTPPKQKPEYWNGNIPWVSPKDMKKSRLGDSIDHISDLGLENGSKLAPTNSVLFVVRGMILAKDVPIALINRPMAVNQDMRVAIPNDTVQSIYLLYAATSRKAELKSKVGRSAHGTMTLMSQTIADFMIPIPDLETQEEISRIFETIEGKIEIHERKLTTLNDLFRTLLHELMTAKRRVNELEFEGLEMGS